MAADPVATAASDNPMLSDLVAAVRKAKLFAALNAASALTVFAPDNAAFARISPAQLASGLTLHTLEGGTIKTAREGRP